MSDESRTANPAASIHVNHYCCVIGCGQWGGLGFSKDRGEPKWWCAQHYPHWPNRARYEAAEIADMLDMEKPATVQPH